MFINHSAAENIVFDSPHTVDVYSTTAAYSTLRALISYVDNSRKDLLKLGLRPDVDLIMHVPSTTSLKRGWKVVWNSTNYEVYKVEQEESNSTKRVILKELGSSGIDLDV